MGLASFLSRLNSCNQRKGPGGEGNVLHPK